MISGEFSGPYVFACVDSESVFDARSFKEWIELDPPSGLGF